MGALKAWLCGWLGIDNLWLECTAIRTENAHLKADILTLEKRITLTPMNVQAHDSKQRPLSGAALRRLNEQINARALEEENHG
jgi:hypothetical protein